MKPQQCVVGPLGAGLVPCPGVRPENNSDLGKMYLGVGVGNLQLAGWNLCNTVFRPLIYTLCASGLVELIWNEREDINPIANELD